MPSGARAGRIQHAKQRRWLATDHLRSICNFWMEADRVMRTTP
jgi:hypothetical protein